MSNENKYIAIKVKGLNHWLWFEKEKVEDDNVRFVGKAGWGKGGTFTEISIDVTEITGIIYSDRTQISS